MELTLLQAAKSLSAYPIPTGVVATLSLEHGVDPEAPATREAMATAGYRRVKAGLLLWLSQAPDVSQGGQSYSFTSEERKRLRARAEEIARDSGESLEGSDPIYGYKGDRL